MTEHDSRIHREFLKSGAWERFDELQTDQRKRLPRPPLQQPFPEAAPRVALVPPAELTVGTLPLIEVLRRRESHRQYAETPLTLEELSFLLWATQGVRGLFREGLATFRTVPSAGARHPFETYLVVNRVEGVKPGLYRYLSLEHELGFLREDPELPSRAAEACNGQPFVARSAVTFFWTAIPYRTEWRYGLLSPKLIALDAGHVCQNLYLAAEAIGAGACAVASYDQRLADALLGVDGEEEFVIYAAPVGKVAGP